MRNRNQSIARSAVAALGAAMLLVTAGVMPAPVLAQGYHVTEGGGGGTSSDFVSTREVPAGTLVKVIVLDPISSATNQVGDQVRMRVAKDDESGVPKSVVFVGHVHRVAQASGSNPGEISVRFDGFTTVGNWQPVGNPQPTETAQAYGKFVGSGGSNGGNSTVGIGAAAGAVIGGSRKGRIGEALEGGLLGALAGLAVKKATSHSASDINLNGGQEVSIVLKRPITLKIELVSD